MTHHPAPTPDAPPSQRSSPFASLAHRPFRWWFVSQVVSASGGMTQAVATAWLVLQMTDSAVALGGPTVATMLPVLLLGAAGGTVVDRFDRRRILIWTQAVLAVLGVALYLFVEADAAGYWLILAFSAAGGMVMAVDGPARQVYVLDLVGRERLASAVSLYEVILNTSRVVGPAASAVVLVVWGAGPCILLNAVTFLVPLAVLLVQRPPKRDAPAPRPRERGAARAGLRYAWSVPLIRSCLLIAAASGIIFNFGVLMPVLTTHEFHLGSGGYGALLAVFGVGAVPGALLAARTDAPTSRQVGLLAGGTGALMILTAFAPAVPLLFAGMAGIGFVSIWMIAAANTLVQLRTEPALRGRVMGAWTMALPGMNPITGIAMGALAQVTNARIVYAAAGLLLVAIVTGSRSTLLARAGA